MKTAPNTEFRYSILRISGKYFGIEVQHVREVCLFPVITKVPNVHKSILGVFNLRGQIVSVIDIRKIMNLPDQKITDDNFVVIIESKDITLGFVVEKVLDVFSVDSTKINVPTRDMSLNIVQYCNGYYTHKKLGDVFLLDMEALFDAREIGGYSYTLGA